MFLIIPFISATWFNTSWKACINLSQMGNQNYTYLVRLNNTNFNYSYAQSTLSDLRIFPGTCDAPDGIEVNYWLTEINTSGYSMLWIRTPSNTTTGNFALYFNNSAATNSSNYTITNTFEQASLFDDDTGLNTFNTAPCTRENSVLNCTGATKSSYIAINSTKNNAVGGWRVLFYAKMNNWTRVGIVNGSDSSGNTGVWGGVETSATSFKGYSGAWTSLFTITGNTWITYEWLNITDNNAKYDTRKNYNQTNDYSGFGYRAAANATKLVFGTFDASQNLMVEWFIQMKYNTTAQTPTLSSIDIYAGGGATGEPTIEYDTGTTTTNSKWINDTQQNISVSIKVTNFTATNTTIYLYNGSTLYQTISNTTNSNYTHNFTNLPPTTYYFNATSKNATTQINLTSRNAIIYSQRTLINTPSNNFNATRNITITYTTTTQPTQSPAIINITTYYLRLLNSDGSLNSTINTSTHEAGYNWDYLSTHNLTTTTYYIHLNTTNNETYTKPSDNTILINITRNAQLNITAKYTLTNATIGNFSINITDNATGITETWNSSNNITSIPIIKEHNYTITIDAPEYAISNTTYNATNSTYQNTTISTYTANSVYIYIYDANTLTLINDTNTTIKFTGTSIITYTTTNGTHYQDNLTDGSWTIKFTNTNYSTKYYSISVANRSHQTLNAFLVSDEYNTIFTIQNSITSLPIENATFTSELYNASGWITMDSLYTDISGKVQIYYLSGENYKFTITKTGYATKIFQLNPILFSNYIVSLEPTTSSSSPQDFADISITKYPTIFINEQLNNFTFLITSPLGRLINYTINLTYPGGSNGSNGSNAQGESILLWINITGATHNDNVNLTITYTATDAGFKNYSYAYEIINTGESNQTIIHLKYQDYGLGLGEKAIISTIIIVFIAGFSYLLGGLGTSLFMGSIGLAISSFLGFLPIWSILISILIAIMLIVKTGTGGQG